MQDKSRRMDDCEWMSFDAAIDCLVEIGIDVGGEGPGNVSVKGSWPDPLAIIGLSFGMCVMAWVEYALFLAIGHTFSGESALRRKVYLF